MVLCFRPCCAILQDAPERSRIAACSWDLEPMSSILLLQDSLQCCCLSVYAQQTTGVDEKDLAIPPLIWARRDVCQEGVPCLATVDAIENDACTRGEVSHMPAAQECSETGSAAVHPAARHTCGLGQACDGLQLLRSADSVPRALGLAQRHKISRAPACDNHHLFKIKNLAQSFCTALHSCAHPACPRWLPGRRRCPV